MDTVRRSISSISFRCAPLSPPSALPGEEAISIGTFRHHASCKNPIPFCRIPHRPIFPANFHKSVRVWEKSQFLVEPTTASESPSPSNKKFSEDADKICKMLSAQPIPSIRTCLENAGIRVSPDVAAEVLKKLSNAGTVALSFFRWAETQERFAPTTEVFHHLIDALGKIKQFRLIWILVESINRRGLLRKETFALIIRRYARARKIGEAIEAFEKMEDFGLKPDGSDYNSLIDIISKSRNNAARAQTLLSDLIGRGKFSPDLKTYTILLEGWGRERNLERMKEVLGEMIKEKLEPDVVTYGILMSAFCRSGNCDGAIEAFRDMETKGCNPSPHIYCTLINGLGAAKRLEEALRYFEMSEEGNPPEAPTYNAVVGSYCWASRFEDAFRIVDRMKNLGIGPNARTFDIILHHLIRLGRTEEAMKLFEGMDCEAELNTYSMMVGLLCGGERVDLALGVWRKMRERGVPPCMHMFSALISGLLQERRMEEACEFFKEMLDRGIRPSGQLFSKLKEALLEVGKKDLAYSMSLKLDRLRKTQLLA